MLEVHFTVTLYCRLKSLQVVKLIWGSQLCQLCLVWVCVFYHTSMQDLQRWYFVVKLDKEVQHATIELKASCLARERCLMPNSISPCLSARMKMLLTGCRDVSRCCWWCNIDTNPTCPSSHCSTAVVVVFHIPSHVREALKCKASFYLGISLLLSDWWTNF